MIVCVCVSFSGALQACFRGNFSAPSFHFNALNCARLSFPVEFLRLFECTYTHSNANEIQHKKPHTLDLGLLY